MKKAKKTIRVEINFPESSTNDVKVITSVEIEITMDFDTPTGSSIMDSALEGVKNLITSIPPGLIAAVVLLLAVVGIALLPAAGAGATVGGLAAVLLAFISRFWTNER